MRRCVRKSASPPSANRIATVISHPDISSALSFVYWRPRINIASLFIVYIQFANCCDWIRSMCLRMTPKYLREMFNVLAAWLKLRTCHLLAQSKPITILLAAKANYYGLLRETSSPNFIATSISLARPNDWWPIFHPNLFFSSSFYSSCKLQQTCSPHTDQIKKKMEMKFIRAILRPLCERKHTARKFMGWLAVKRST